MSSRNLKKYFLSFVIVILPIGGFFVLLQQYSLAREIKPAQAINITATDASATPVETLIETATPVAAEQATPIVEDKTTEPQVVPETPVVASKSASCDKPVQILNTTCWKETLPTGSSEKPSEIGQASLANFSGNTYFHANQSCDGVVFKAPVNGVTTSGSGYPRSELREMSADGKKMASWSTTSGTNTMFIDEAITAIPKNKQHVVAGQIHDANDDVVVIRLEYPKLFVDINGKTGPVLDANYTLGKRFTVKFVASGGQIKIYYNGNQTPAYSMSKPASGCYFKAGAYTQSNCSKEKDCSENNFGEVTIYKLSVEH